LIKNRIGCKQKQQVTKNQILHSNFYFFGVVFSYKMNRNRTSGKNHFREMNSVKDFAGKILKQ